MTSKPLIMVLALFFGAVAHPEGELKLETTTLTPGMVLHLTGKKFPKNEALDVLLAGPARRSQLKHITTDAEGSFHDFVIVPEGLPAGSYRIVLVASDDDEVAAADVQLSAGSAPTAAAPADPMAGHDMSKMGEASAEPLALARARSRWVTGGAFVAILLALAVGAVAVLRPRAA